MIVELLEFVAATNQFLEDRSHRMVVDARRRQVDLRVEELVDEGADGVSLGQRLELIAKLEVIEDVLNVLRETVEVVLEVCEELLLVTSGLEVT